MPTGYTADLESNGYNVKKWLKESVVRAFGVCMSLRDEGRMTENEIMKALKTPDNWDNYHTRKLQESADELEKFSSISEQKLQATYAEEQTTAQTKFEKDTEEFNRKKISHLKALAETTAMYNRAVTEKQDELTVNALKFAVDQLNQAFDFDFGHGPYRPEVLEQTFTEWVQQRLKGLQRDIEYHSKEAVKETERVSDKAATYQKFVDFVNRF